MTQMLIGQFSPLVLMAVATGGALGATARYMVSVWGVSRFGDAYPIGTLLANWLGSFMIGVVVALLASRILESDYWRPLLVVGLLGGLTTFSTFSLEMLQFLQRGQFAIALIYLLISVTGCVALTYLGYSLAISR